MNSSIENKNKHILIVDDEPDVLELLKIYLETHHWNVTTASSPINALKLLETQDFFLILTDIAMPEMDGYEFISKLNEKNIRSQIALMTGFGYNPKHTLLKINKKSKYPIFFKPFEFKKPKLQEAVVAAWERYNAETENKTLSTQ